MVFLRKTSVFIAAFSRLAAHFVHSGAVQKPDFSPYAAAATPNRLLWGHAFTHIFPFGCGTAGNTRGPDEACSFARRRAVTSSSGQLLQPMTYYDGGVAEGEDLLPLSVAVQSTM